jgi:hypothetical protein
MNVNNLFIFRLPEIDGVALFLALKKSPSAMKILFIPRKNYPEFEAHEDGKLLLYVKIDNASQAFRINCNGRQRVFFLSDEAEKKTGVVSLLNEYGHQLGAITRSDAIGRAGEIEIDEVHFKYSFNSGNLEEINILGGSNGEHDLHCEVEPDRLAFPNEGYLNYLLFALAWFSLLKKEQPTEVQMAEA